MFKKLFIFVLFLALPLFIISSNKAYALEVPALAEDNLIENPWFREDPITSNQYARLDGWFDGTSSNPLDYIYWSVSQKDSNPAPDTNEGTSARLANGCGRPSLYGCGVSGEDAYLYQIVTANPLDTTLKFSTHYVTQYIDVAETKVYGSLSPEGPWTEVWQPFYVNQTTSQTFGTWVFWDEVTTELEAGYPYYKVEFHGRYPLGRSQGFKFTGVYFATEGTGSSNQTPVATINTNVVSGDMPLQVSFDASSSYDADGTIVSYNWDFGDGNSSQEMLAENIYTAAGEYTVTLTVVDELGASSQSTTIINVIDPNFNYEPVASIEVLKVSDLEISYDASASYDVDGAIVSYNWDFGDGVQSSDVQGIHAYTTYGTYNVMLTVTDDDDASVQVMQTVSVTEPVEVSNELGYWNFDENSGTNVADLSGNSFDGTLINNVTWNEGVLGSGLNFVGQNGYVNISEFSGTGSQIALSFWIRPNNVNGPAEIYNEFANQSIVVHKSHNQNGVTLRIKTNTASAVVSSSSGLVANEWNHVAVSYDGTTATIYINGDIVATRSISGSLNIVGPLYISSSVRPVNGSLDELRIYDVALTPEEVSSLATL